MSFCAADSAYGAFSKAPLLGDKSCVCFDLNPLRTDAAPVACDFSSRKRADGTPVTLMANEDKAKANAATAAAGGSPSAPGPSGAPSNKRRRKERRDKQLYLAKHRYCPAGLQACTVTSEDYEVSCPSSLALRVLER